MEHLYDVAIVGGGIAGYSAALTAHNLLLDYIWLGEGGFGDKLRLAEKITNYPAISGRGSDFYVALENQRAKEGVLLTPAPRVDGVYETGGQYLLTAGKETFSAKAVILATGVETKGNVKGEREFVGRGVSYCAVCDGALYRGKRIAVVVYSEKFEEEVEYLARFADMVSCFCLYKGATLQGEHIEIRTEKPIAIEGEGHVERIVFEGGSLPVEAVFFLKDSAPPEALCGGLETEGAHVKVGRDLSTNLAGLYAAGDITGRPYQYVKAAGEGCVAAHSVKNYLHALKKQA